MAYEITIIDAGGGLEASFVPGLGMIGTSLRHQGEELLHQGRGLAAYAQHGSTFGIPFLHPWANRLSAWEFDLDGQHIKLDPDSPVTHRDGPTDTPIHGLLAASPHWTVVDADRDTLVAELDFGAVPEYMAVFPFAHRLRYTATLADPRLTVNLSLMAGPERAVPISFGFHPYLTLPGSDRASWQIELPVASQALVDERQIPTGETVEVTPGELDGPLGERTFDTSYPSLRGHAFSLADHRRKLTLTHVSGFPVAQVYAPDDSDFICFEPMTAPVDALISGDGLNWVAPGDELTAIFTISIE